MQLNKSALRTSAIAAGLAMAFTAGHVQGSNLFGIDVSGSQGSINWSSVKANGAEFAFAKATEGNYFEDGEFKTNMKNGKAAGLQMGAYHYARPDIDCVSTEANYFWNFAGGQITADGKSLYPAVDFEVVGNSCQPNPTAWFNAWGKDVEAKSSNTLHPVIFVNACGTACDLIEYDKTGGIQLSAWVGDANNGTPLGSGHPWVNCPCCNAWVIGCGTGNWTYWLAASGNIGGVSGTCDFDAYNGSLSSLISNEGVK